MAPPPPIPPPSPHPYGGRGPEILGVTWAEFTLALIFMVMRTYTNAYIVKSFRWDYFWALLVLVMGFVTQILLTISAANGMGNHIGTLGGMQTVTALKYSWIGQCMLIFAIGFGKIAVIAFLLRIQNRTNSRLNTALVWFLYFIAAINFIVNVVQCTMILTTCDPLDKLWNQELPGTCNGLSRTNYFGYFQGSVAALSDILLAVYPILVFWSVKISNKLKIGLCFLMGGGIIAAVAGAMKTYEIHLIASKADITYEESGLLLWAWTENWLVLILGSLPPLKPLFHKFYHKTATVFTRTKVTTKGGSYGQHSEPRSINMYSMGQKPMGNDGDSVRHMLRDGNIVRTVDVQVSRDQKEMHSQLRDNSVGSLDDLESARTKSPYQV